MTGVIIIGAIGTFLLFIFLMDKKDETDKINREGGFLRKYGTLIHYFHSADPRMKVEKKAKDSIVIGVTDRHARTSFTLIHSFEKINIIWNHRSAGFGGHKLSWSFNEYESQEKIISIIENELSIYQQKVITNS